MAVHWQVTLRLHLKQMASQSTVLHYLHCCALFSLLHITTMDRSDLALTFQFLGVQTVSNMSMLMTLVFLQTTQPVMCVTSCIQTFKVKQAGITYWSRLHIQQKCSMCFCSNLRVLIENGNPCYHVSKNFVSPTSCVMAIISYQL